MFQDSLLAPRPAWVRDALRALVRHRFLTARQLAVATGVCVEQVSEGLDALVADGLLRRVGGPVSAAPVAVTLGATALALLARDGEPVPARTMTARRSLHTLTHDLAVNELGVVLERLHAVRATALRAWCTAREQLADVAHVAEKGRPLRVPLVADALAVLGHVHGSTALLVEVDRGTVSATRMLRKYRAYHAWWREGGPVRRFGVGALRILTLTSTRRRLERLRELATSAAPPQGTGLFWFAPLDAVDVEAPTRLLDAVALVARTNDHTPRTLLDAASAPT